MHGKKITQKIKKNLIIAKNDFSIKMHFDIVIIFFYELSAKKLINFDRFDERLIFNFQINKINQFHIFEYFLTVEDRQSEIYQANICNRRNFFRLLFIGKPYWRPKEIF